MIGNGGEDGMIRPHVEAHDEVHGEAAMGGALYFCEKGHYEERGARNEEHAEKWRKKAATRTGGICRTKPPGRVQLYRGVPFKLFHPAG